jgi:hypothetical protein
MRENCCGESQGMETIKFLKINLTDLKFLKIFFERF